MTDSNRRVLRTVFQNVLSLAGAAPLIVAASGVAETTAGVGVGLAIAAGVTKVMALPAVNAVLPSWLRKSGDSAA